MRSIILREGDRQVAHCALLVHCRRGKSRSTALGLVLLRHHRGPGTENECLEELLRIRPIAAPNLAIVEHGDALLACGGALIRAVESNPKVARQRADAHAARGPHTVMVSWHLGKANEARAQILESIYAAEGWNKPVRLATALTYACMLHRELREPAKVQEVAERLLVLAREHQFLGMLPFGSVFLGWALAEHGKPREGIELIRDGLDSMVRAGAAATVLTVLSEAQAAAGRFDEALGTIEQRLVFAKRSAIELQSVLWRRGELHQRRGGETEAERDLREALEVTRRIGSKACELRATSSLVRLLMKQGKREEARAMLADIYNWFTEGFDTADLKDAKALLQELSA